MAQQDQTVQEIWAQFPPVTRNVCAAAAIINIIIRFYPPSILVFYLLNRVPVTKPWTLVTSAVAGSSHPMSIAMAIPLLWVNLRRLEDHSSRIRRGNLLFLLAFTQVMSIIIGPYFGFHGFLEIHCSAITYICAQESPNTNTTLFGVIEMPNGLLPWANAGIGLLMNGISGTVQPLLGIFVGHMFIYLTELLPRAGGPGLDCPQVFNDLARKIDPEVHQYGTNPPTASRPRVGKTSAGPQSGSTFRFSGQGHKLGG